MFSKLFNRKDTQKNFFGEYFSSKAPNQKTISFRAICLGAMLLRNEYEMYTKKLITDPMIPITNDYPTRVTSWYSSNKISDYLSSRERELLNKPWGSWTNQEIINTSWRNQALGVLLWSLSYYEEIPKPPIGFTLQNNLLSKLHALESIQTFLTDAKLRSVSEIREERDRAEHWHWRSRIGINPSKELTSYIKEAADHGYKDGFNQKPIQNDFPVSDKAFKDLNEKQYRAVSSIIMERHYTLNWLCGFSKNWDDVGTDT